MRTTCLSHLLCVLWVPPILIYLNKNVISVLFVLVFRDIKVKAPFGVKSDEIGVHYTYLDTVGRPVIIMKKDNVVDSHIQDMEVCMASYL